MRGSPCAVPPPIVHGHSLTRVELNKNYESASSTSLMLVSSTRTIDDGWFWPGLSQGDAARVLSSKPSGTFLVRSGGRGRAVITVVGGDAEIRHVKVHYNRGGWAYKLSQQRHATLSTLFAGYSAYPLVVPLRCPAYPTDSEVLAWKAATTGSSRNLSLMCLCVGSHLSLGLRPIDADTDAKRPTAPPRSPQVVAPARPRLARSA